MLDQAYFILLGQRHPAVGVFGHAIPILPLRHHVIQIEATLLQLGGRPIGVGGTSRYGNIPPPCISRIGIAGGNSGRLRSGCTTKEHAGKNAGTKNCHQLFHNLLVKFDLFESYTHSTPLKYNRFGKKARGLSVDTGNTTVTVRFP